MVLLITTKEGRIWKYKVTGNKKDYIFFEDTTDCYKLNKNTNDIYDLNPYSGEWRHMKNYSKEIVSYTIQE